MTLYVHQRPDAEDELHAVWNWLFDRLSMPLGTNVELAFGRTIGDVEATMHERKGVFLIIIMNGLEHDYMIQNFVHECIHVWQIVRGSMGTNPLTGLTTWNSVDVPDDTEYDQLPWEVEAYGLERLLMLEWFSIRDGE